jgi:pimeloyl-ACP methyl ester carboxylesterase
MRHLVFLPASAPGDEGLDLALRECALLPGTIVGEVTYAAMVWYNEEVCSEAVRQISAFGDESVILVGFSKSGLGAWNIARRIPDHVNATIIFDAPASRGERPPWEIDAFYGTDAEWQRDQPIRTVPDFAANINPRHHLVLISGELFHDEMAELAKALAGTAVRHTFLARPELKHQWQSGWLGEALELLGA